MAKFVQSATVLEVKDIKASEAFYREKLGFRPGLFFGEPPTFCIVSRDNVAILLDLVRTPRAAPINQYWAAYLYVDDVDAIAADLKARGVALDREVEDQPYGCRDFDVRDPDGHVIGIGQNERSAEGKLTLPTRIDQMSLKGKTLFITGASRGIGLAIALRCARDGANIAIAAKTETPHPKLEGTIHTAAEAIEKAGGRALPLAVDVRDEDAVKNAIDKTAVTFGGLDIVVNNASAVSRTSVADTDMKRFDLMHQINARGTFMVSKYAIPHLLKAANPHILMNSPPLDMREKWFAGSTGYSMAKFGMSLVALGLAGELRGKVAVNTLWPRTTIATAAIKNLLGGERMMRMSRTPEIMADAAYTIFHKDAKTFTGHFLIDDSFLAGEGVTDFEKYRAVPGEPLAGTFFVPDEPAPPPGVSVTGNRWE